MIQSQLERAQQLVTQQRYKDAETELRSILAQDPNNTQALALFAICLSELDRQPEAIQIIQSAIGQEPDNDYLLYLQSLFYFKADKLKDSEKFIRNAIAYDPHNADYLGLLAAIKLNQKEWKEALEYANNGLENDPDNLQCLNARSTALYKLDKKEEAYSTIQEALNKNPENELTHTNLGWSLLEKGEHKKALEHFREALKINPNYTYAKAGLVEGLKARYWFYRIFLKYSFWISNFKGQQQWIIIIGLYIGVRVLRNVAESNPALAPLLYPIVYLYMAFAISTWVITPLSNLFLRLNVYGRYALREEEISSSNLVGISLLVSIAGFAGLLLTGNFLFMMLGIFGIAMMIPLSSMYNPVKKSSRTILMVYTGFLALTGIGAMYEFMNTGEIGMLSNVFIFGVLIYQWVANALIVR
ncbi:tetratricopeptide repeat protein [Ohtaekwangia koreensis]|uniref:TPR repeat-containing protein n=1 Tax=Ohtaekwangia koreensis TaxID=688867 RepID=A0A1T5IN04_9BACT|nr:tetratricopeptide repeat protein [Ohtaekwangia koreensis]SKC40388.1 TPR repeat-containing protein [Ohtaekwangia koreensis]